MQAYIGRVSDEQPYKGALDVLPDAPHRSLRQLVAFEATQRVRSPCAVYREESEPKVARVADTRRLAICSVR